MENGRVTIYDVAERAGVSIATVSRAMSGGSISAKSRQKVQEAIEALHYQPSTAHSHPQGQEKRTGTLALVIGDFDNPYCSMLMRGAELEATRHGYALEVFCHTPGTITNDQMIRRLLEHRPDGVALTGGLVEDGPAEVILDNLKRLHHAMPVVTIGPLIEGMSSINIASDSFEGVRKVMTHLTNLGHRRESAQGSLDKLEEETSELRAAVASQQNVEEELGDVLFAAVNAAACLEVDPEMALHAACEKFIRRFRTVEQLADKPLPTAIVAINDVCALGVLSHLKKSGFRVPQDIALTGCDNLFFTQYLDPPLTTVDLRATERGSFAMEELINALNGGDTTPISHKLECSLIVRESCGAMLGRERFR